MRFPTGSFGLVALVLSACSPQASSSGGDTSLERVMLEHGKAHAATSAPTDRDEHAVVPVDASPAPAPTPVGTALAPAPAGPAAAATAGDVTSP